MSKLKPLTPQQTQAVLDELDHLAHRVAKVGNVIGPALGAAWCDKALKLDRRIYALKVAVQDALQDQAAGRRPHA